MTRNLLDQETSPYLLQHKDNPVHWRPWGPEALAEAAASHRPILLSVGYAACHWCHVMAHESFENAGTAALINRWFVPIKVDREERPDIDAIYQTALALIGQSGGWPLTMFLTPEGQPFWGGTYFPPEARYGRPAFREILTRLAETWETKPDTISSNVSALSSALAQQMIPSPGETALPSASPDIARAILRMVDPREGGLDGAPKFPQVSIFELLWRAWHRDGEENFRKAVILTLDRICQGGIYDHLGGGFSRYSTDAHWLVPHFEKMLYDNAQLVELLTQVWRETGSPLFARRIEETVSWLEREMIAEHGAFAATLDADSVGGEGAFYVWTKAGIEARLSQEDSAILCRLYDVTADGNWEDHSILHRNHAEGGFDQETEGRLDAARAILLAARERRPRPGRDDKILADWNGMMIGALARAAFTFDRADWLAAARRAFSAVTQNMGREGRLGHSLRWGRLQPEAMLDDYAQMARAGVLLYETTGDPDFLVQAERWVEQVEIHYADPESGAYFFTADDAPGLILRSATAIDHAAPSGNAVMVEVLARLYHLTGEDSFRRRAEAVMGAFAGEVAKAYPSMAALLNAWEMVEGAVRVAIIGTLEDPGRARLLRVVAEAAPPMMVLLQSAPDGELPAGFERPAASDAHAAALICRGATCSLPITDRVRLRQALLQR